MDISKSNEGEKTVLTVMGRVDTTTAPAFETALAGVAGVASLVIDLAGVPYMSSAGLRCLLSAQKGCVSVGGALEVRGAQPAVREIFDITGFSDILTLV